MKNIITLLTLTFFYGNVLAQVATLSGTIQSPFNEAVEATSITLYDANDNVVAITSGSDFTFAGLNEGDTYKIAFEKNDSPLNGVSTFDIVLIMKHILAVDPISSPYLLYAADVNSSTSITVFDIVLLRKLILAIDTALPVPSWQFLPAGLTDFPTATTFNEIEVEITSDNVVVEVIGFKMGDINGTAIPD